MYQQMTHEAFVAHTADDWTTLVLRSLLDYDFYFSQRESFRANMTTLMRRNGNVADEWGHFLIKLFS
jgi:hypothetical protein